MHATRTTPSSPTSTEPFAKGYRGAAMEGGIARRYDRLRGTPAQVARAREQARAFGAAIPDGAPVLEVAPGPGYFAIELARLHRFPVTGLDISHTFVALAQEKARRERLPVDFREGDATRMPFADGSFARIISQAAFKNFAFPDRVLAEMYRVLRPQGVAVIQDMSREATNDSIRAEVRSMELGWLSGFVTYRTLLGLRRRAYSPEQFRELAASSPFGDAQVASDGIGLEVRLQRREARP